MADRYTYLPQIGLYVAIAWGAADVAGSWPYRRWALAAVSALVVAVLMVCAWQQTRYWRNSETLWTHTLACTSQNPIALTTTWAARWPAADRSTRRSPITGRPWKSSPTTRRPTTTSASPWPAADRSTRRSPITGRPWKSSPTTRRPTTTSGMALAGRGQVDEAIAHYRKALEIKPDYAEAHNNLGNALAGRGQVDEAIAHYRKALKIKPDYAEAHNNLGIALAGRGQVDEAIAQYRKALEIKPDYAEAHNNLGSPWPAADRSTRRSPITARPWKSSPTTPRPTTTSARLAGRGEVDEAIAHFRKALEIKPDYAEAHYNLGLVLAGRGQVDEAMDHYRKALGLASARNDKALADAIRAQIRLHQSVAPAGNAR